MLNIILFPGSRAWRWRCCVTRGFLDKARTWRGWRPPCTEQLQSGSCQVLGADNLSYLSSGISFCLIMLHLKYQIWTAKIPAALEFYFSGQAWISPGRQPSPACQGDYHSASFHQKTMTTNPCAQLPSVCVPDFSNTSWSCQWLE